MRYLTLVAAAIAVAGSASTALAQTQATRDCLVSGTLAPLGANSVGTIDLSSAESCNLFLNTSGVIESSAISQQPKNGRLTMVTSANAIYTPKPGYQGTDEFAFTIKGSNQNISGTSVVTIRANVK